jgi:CDP-diacylglycerol---glycerol-3-phosphate 3-phosphatidyltransferase
MTTTEKTYGPTALLTPANIMTSFRIVISPVFIYLLIFHRVTWLTVVVGLTAAASDYFDGIVARRHGTTTFGAFLDPLADKIMVLGSLYALIISRPHGLTSFIVPSVLISLREIWMSYFRARMAGRGISVPATQLAKWKTFVQDWAIGFNCLPFTAKYPIFGEVTIWVATFMTLYTGWLYYVGGKKGQASAR